MKFLTELKALRSKLVLKYDTSIRSARLMGKKHSFGPETKIQRCCLLYKTVIVYQDWGGEVKGDWGKA